MALGADVLNRLRAVRAYMVENKEMNKTMKNSSESNSQNTEDHNGKPKTKDVWDKLDVASKALIPILLFIGGFWVNNRLNVITQRQTNIRTALELQNGRESTETELRGSMFAKILDRYSKSGAEENLTTQLLYLELLIANFNQSLDLSPMLKEVSRRIGALQASEEKEKLLTRLNYLLADAQSKQLSSISTEGAVEQFVLREGDFASKDLVILSCEQGSSNPTRIPIRVSLTGTPSEATTNINLTRFKRAGDKLIKNTYPVTLDSSDLPLIDNIRVAPGIRVALLINPKQEMKDKGKLNQGNITINITAFYDKIASLKDRPSVTDYLQSLNNDIKVNPESKQATSAECQEIARPLSFVAPTDFDFSDLKLSN